MPFGREILSSTYCGSPEKKALSDFSHGTTQLSNTMEICILINCLYSYSNRFRRRCTPKCRHQSWRHSSGRHQRWIAAYWIPKSEHTELNELSIRESLKFQAESDAPRRLQAVPFMHHQAKLANWFRIIEFHFSLFSSRPLIWVCIPWVFIAFLLGSRFWSFGKERAPLTWAWILNHLFMTHRIVFFQMSITLFDQKSSKWVQIN